MFTLGPVSRATGESLLAAMDYVFNPTASLQLTVFGVNYSPNNGVYGDPQLVRDVFRSYLAPEVGTCTFETFADRTSPAFSLPPFVGGAGPVVGTVYGDATTRLGVVSGRFNTTPGGNSHLQISGSADIEFSPGVAAVGFYGTDFGDFAGSMVVKMRNAASGVITVYPLPAAISGPNGNLVFWGVLSTTETFDQMTVETADGGTYDLFSIDDLIVATASQVYALSENPYAAGAAPVTVVFSDVSSGAVTRQWDFDNNGVVDSTAQVVSHTYTTPGVYRAKLTVSNGSASSVTLSDPIVVGSSSATAPPAGLQLYWADAQNGNFFVTSGTPTSRALTTWLAASPCGAVVESFSTHLPSSPLPLSVFGGQGTLAMSAGALGVGRIANLVGGTPGVFNTTGSVDAPSNGPWWQSEASFELTFNAPIRGFSTYITAAADFGGTLTMVLTTTSGSTVTVPVNTSNLTGALLFVGFTDDTQQYTKVSFVITQSAGLPRILGFDDMAFTTCVPTGRSSWPMPT